MPLGFLLWGSLKVGDPQSASPPTLENYRQAYTDPGAYQLLLNSLLYALGSSVFSLLLGTMLAWTIERTNTPFKSLFSALAMVPLIIPGILHTMAWVLLLSPRSGVMNSLLQSILGLSDPLFKVYSLPAMIWVQGLHLSPLVFVTMAAAVRSMDPALEEAAMVSGGSVPTTVRRITLRLLLPAIASMFLIMFIRGLESFEVPALLGLRGGIKVFTSRIWLAIKLDRNFGLAGAFAATLLVISVAGIILYNRLTARAERFATVTGKAFRPHIIDLGRWRYAAGAFFILYFLFLVGLPLFILLWTSLNPFYSVPSVKALSRLTLDNYIFVLNMTRARTAIVNSLLLAIGSATLVMLLTSIISWITVRTRIPGRSLLDAVTFLPITFPGIVLGVSLIWVYLTLPIPIYGTLWILLVAYITRYMPYGIRTASSSMVQIHAELEEAAHISGASWLQTFGRIILPLLRPGLVAGWIYVVIVSMRELSSSILLYSSRSLILSVLIFDLWDGGQFTIVAALSVLMITGLILLVVIAYGLGSRFGVRE
ncbi:MAG: iron ABC transporter permease [Fidelibacterota bacterium]|nr:MAG: iron ABC transporter permease [Candidatus Neomarinimicrobiota bacterium]